jgi:hypothetical protein
VVASDLSRRVERTLLRVEDAMQPIVSDLDLKARVEVLSESTEGTWD